MVFSQLIGISRMNTNHVLQRLDSRLPNPKIAQDIAQQLDKIALRKTTRDRDEVEIEVEDQAIIIVPRQTPVEIITKALYKEYFDISFGTGYRVLAALGGIKEIECGIIEPVYSFITLHYDSELNIITVDFHRNMIFPRG